jgi:hypothetical protein
VPSEVLNTLPPFCFPAGGRIYASRPPEATSGIFSFAIAHSGYYVTCLNYHQPADATVLRLAWESLHPREAGAVAAETSPFDGVGDFVYVPAALCLLSRQPYLDVLHEAAALLLTMLLAPHCPLASLSEAIRVLRWVPQPPPGNMVLRFAFCGEDLACAAAPAGNLPLIDTAMHPFFLYFGADAMLKLVFALLMEQRVLIFSSNLAALTPFMQVRPPFFCFCTI